MAKIPSLSSRDEGARWEVQGAKNGQLGSRTGEGTARKAVRLKQ